VCWSKWCRTFIGSPRAACCLPDATETDSQTGVWLMRLAKRVEGLKAEGAYQVLTRAKALEREGREIIHLEIGQPDFDTVPIAALAGVRAITTGLTRYNPPSGIPVLRAAIAEDAGARRGLRINREQVVVAPGAKPIIFFAMLALVEPGDEVIYPNPGFPTYESVIGFLGAVPVPISLPEEHGFSFDMEVFSKRVSARAKLIILNSPGNPTGSIIPRADLGRIAEAAVEHDCWVLSDEIYSRMLYDERKHISIATFPGMQQRTVIVDGFSKTYAMTGWRLGYGIMPVDLAQAMDRLLTNSVGCTATFTQHAGLEAITGRQDDVDGMVTEFERRRNEIVDGLNAIPNVTCQKPEGAFYVFPNIKAFGKTSEEIASYLLDVAGVAVLPGTAFGSYGEGYLRLSYANSLENIERALDWMAEALSHL